MKRVLLHFALFVALATAGGLLYAWSGLYHIGASSGHWAITRAILDLAMTSSIRTHSLGIEPPPLDDVALIERGAGHFWQGCEPCHGAPGRPRGAVVRQMVPLPPYLPDTVDDWEVRELFWIVKHGLKYTAMPGWASQARDDEVWAVVAFLLRLPGISAAEYLALSGGAADPAAGKERPGISQLPPVPEDAAEALENCRRCHGLDGMGRNSGAFPRIAGQNAGYLRLALQAYADGRRASGIMEPAAAPLSDREIRELADYYAAIPLPAEPALAEPDDPAAVERGGRIAAAGAPDRDVPACIACHGLDAPPPNDNYPLLAGQHPGYLANQLRLWRARQRGGSPQAQIMEKVAERLTDRQILDVAQFYSTLRPRRSQLDDEQGSRPTTAPSPAPDPASR